MNYTINLKTGEVTRDNDGAVVAPAQSTDDPLYVAYVAWVNEGNSPTEYNPPEAANKNLTKYEFRKLFTLEERIAIDNAQNNPTISDPNKAILTTVLKDLELSGEVILTNPDVIAGVMFLESIGLLAAGRSAQVIAGLPATA